MTFKEFYKTYRPHGMLAVVTIAIIAIISFWVAYAVLRPMPPSTVLMVTGPEGGAYRETGKRYQKILAKEGIDLQLVPTAGSIENLAQLNNPDSGVSIGLFQGGITSMEESPELETLGTVFHEPLWFFHRILNFNNNLDSLRGRKIAIGQEGSGTRHLTLELLARNKIDQSFADLLPLVPQEAGDKLLRGEIDAVSILTSWHSPVVRKLLASEKIELVDYPRADAYVALYPYLEKLVVPRGVGNLAKDRPTNDVTLLATRASLVVRKDLHPAIQYLLLDAAEQINSKPDIFQKAGQFPAAESMDLPLSKEARQFYRTGRPFLQRALPFWMAAQMNRILIIFIPLLGIIYPLMRFLPFLYDWRMRRRVYRLYGELRFLENNLENPGADYNIKKLAAKLDRLEEKAYRLRVTRPYMDMLYKLREHITLVRERLQKENIL